MCSRVKGYHQSEQSRDGSATLGAHVLHGKGDSVGESPTGTTESVVLPPKAGFRRRDADGGDREVRTGHELPAERAGRAPMKVADDWGTFWASVK